MIDYDELTSGPQDTRTEAEKDAGADAMLADLLAWAGLCDEVDEDADMEDALAADWPEDAGRVA